MRVYIDDPPNFHCFHQHCQDELRNWTEELRRQCEDLPGVVKPRTTRQERELKRHAERERLWELNTRRFLLPELLARPPVALSCWIEQSPYPLPDGCRSDWKLLLSGLFDEWDVVWCGERYDSGHERNVRNFRTVHEWLLERPHPGSLFSIVTFKAKDGLLSRSKHNIEARKFLAIESDNISREAFGNIIRHLQEGGLRLRALIDTGSGRSIHALFDQLGVILCRGLAELLDENPGWQTYPPRKRKAFDREYARREALGRAAAEVQASRGRRLTAILRGLGDRQFQDNLTARLPGCQRYDEKLGDWADWQHLLYLDPIHEPRL